MKATGEGKEERDAWNLRAGSKINDRQQAITSLIGDVLHKHAKESRFDLFFSPIFFICPTQKWEPYYPCGLYLVCRGNGQWTFVFLRLWARLGKHAITMGCLYARNVIELLGRDKIAVINGKLPSSLHTIGHRLLLIAMTTFIMLTVHVFSYTRGVF